MNRILLSSVLLEAVHSQARTAAARGWLQSVAEDGDRKLSANWVTEEDCPARDPNAAELEALGNGNFLMPKTHGIEFAVTFTLPDAAFRNSFGVYFEDDSCKALGGIVLHKDFLAVQYGHTIRTTVERKRIPSGATQFGYFIIPDGGGDHNRNLSILRPSGAVSDNMWVEFKPTDYSGESVVGAFRANGTPVTSYLHSLPAVFTTAHLNPRHIDLIQTENLGVKKEGRVLTYEQNLNIEDGGPTGLTANASGNNYIDYNDVKVNVKTTYAIPPVCARYTQCGDHGSCNADAADNITCECDPGYTGEFCDEDVCSADGVCGDKGNCVVDESPRGYRCDCNEGYRGKDCGKLPKCEDSIGATEGLCQCQSTTSSLLKATCQSANECYPESDTPDGLCRGNVCEDNQTCGANGTCVLATTTTMRGFTCKCLPYYSGENCTTYRHPCKLSHQKNGKSSKRSSMRKFNL